MENKQKISFRISCYFIISLLFSTSLFSQSSVDYKWYANVNGGISQGFGDIQEGNNHISKFQNETGFGYGFRVGRYFHPVFAIHAQLLKSNLQGQKSSYDLAYNSDLIESQLGFSVNILNIFSSEKRNRRVNIYAVSGFGVIFFRSEAKRITTGNLANSYGFKTDGSGDKDTRETALVIPIGGGIDFRLTDKWYINLESVLRITDTDKLDAVESGSKKDAFYYTSLGITYHFGTSNKTTDQIPDKEIAEVPSAVPDYFVNVEYFLPEEVISGEEFEMRCSITKGKINGKAELTQVLPIGFIVKDAMIGGARTEFQNYTLHLYWDELPSDTIFEISYTVMPEKVYGVFPYTSILYLDKTSKEYKFQSSVIVKKEKAKEETTQQELVETEGLPITEVALSEVATGEPALKIEFRVQVRASKQAIVPINQLAQKYHITENIKEDFSGNWHRYSIGSFSTYNDAIGFRNTLIANNGVRDAFVVAYYNGERLNGLSDLKEIDPNNYPGPNTSINESGKLYKVQILAILNNSADVKTLEDIYNLGQEVNEEVFQNWRKYTVGHFTSFEEANELKNTLVEKGLTDAFVVIYQNGIRISNNKNGE
ncbi:MAG: hypothetical protein DRJ05_04720 [Bacteroidetes bacterium]|nr:MAG: hypothetical protein DRJ05_04720 [Bacteroidota bacterium]